MNPTSSPPSTALVRVRIWDLPTRLFHWLLALAVTGAVVSAKIGGNAMVWHSRLGLAVLALLAFRLVWGLVGGHWSRFASFVHGPGALMRHLRGQPRPGEHLDAGHSPTGALSVFALLALVALQLGTGLISDDEIAFTGPLYAWVDSELALKATSWHRSWGQWLLLGMIGLHLAAILFYRLRGTDLVRPMLGGDKLLPAKVPASRDDLRTRALALAIVAAAVALAVWVGAQGG